MSYEYDEKHGRKASMWHDALKEFKTTGRNTDKQLEWLKNDDNLQDVIRGIDRGDTLYHFLASYSPVIPAFPKSFQLVIDRIFTQKVPEDIINFKNREGRTPLFMAVFFGNSYLAKKLLDNGADPTITGKWITGNEQIDYFNLLWNTKDLYKYRLGIYNKATFIKYQECERPKLATNDYCLTPLSIAMIGATGGGNVITVEGKKHMKKIVDMLSSGTSKTPNPQMGVQEEMPSYILKAVTPEVKVHPQYGKLRY